MKYIYIFYILINFFFFTLADWWLICMNLYSNLKSHSYIFCAICLHPTYGYIKGWNFMFFPKSWQSIHSVY